MLLINDRIDIALATNADGVHLGGESLPVQKVRKIIGPNRIIGLSTHHETEVVKAAEDGADFVTYGPVYYTESKAQYGPPAGLDALTSICAKATIPVYALGGIKPEHAAELKMTGIFGIAAISALLETDNAEQTCQLFKL